MSQRSPWKPDRRLFIGLAGGSGSGKTTIAGAVLERLDGQVAHIQHDAYYRHMPELSYEERTKVNYDHPASLETELLVEHLLALRLGQAIERPVYDFAVHLRSDETVRVEPAPVVVVEGILVLAEPELRSELDLKIFVDTDSDVRLARRLQRDIEERGRTVESVVNQYFETVRPMHVQYVEPSKAYADLIIPEGYNPRAVATVVELIRSRLG
ncbi:MAG TPA: uridine kinase [Acidimicrobiia bacterium]|nr:uridine kinase [Acidimicrobiia bacterium]